jgi:group I intron endonuclease
MRGGKNKGNLPLPRSNAARSEKSSIVYKNIDNKIFLSFFKTYNFVKFYECLKNDKSCILKDHKDKKGGIYLLYNKVNNHFYVGSTINISGRMKNYFNKSYLSLKQNLNMPICKALLKYDYVSFALIILEYLPEYELKERESYWIKYLKPYYNVLLEAYRSTGYRHTLETKEKLRNLALGRLHLDSTKNLISIALKGDNNPFYNRKHSLRSKELMSKEKSNRSIYVYDNLCNLQIIFTSLSLFAKIIKANYSTLNTVLNNNLLFIGNWYIKDYLLFEDDVPIIIDKYSIEYHDFINDMRENAHVKQAIYVFNSNTKEFIHKFVGIILAEKGLKIRHEKIKNSIINNTAIDNYIFSYHRLLNIPNM